MNNKKTMYGFALGREFKLSISEILTVFSDSKSVYYDRNILILENITKELILSKINSLGGVIKVIEINNEIGTLEELIEKDGINHEGKFKYGINLYGDNKGLRRRLLDIKKVLKESGVSSRFINKDFQNLSSAQILGENLIERNSDYNSIITKGGVFNGVTIWTQDINSYSKRDYSKDRDMNVGMLPPKLSQMMINLSEGSTIYDPFVGLGTVLIESIIMGNKQIFGSDLSQRMVDTTTTNIDKTIKSYELKDIKMKIFNQNSKFIGEVEILSDNKIDAIVTEGYLGEVMTQKNISRERINSQRGTLLDIYNGFFDGLKKLNYKGTIVISFPFWEIKGLYIFFDEIYELVEDVCEVLPLLPEGYKSLNTKKGSLLYKRDKQLVGREIFKLKMK